MPIAIAGTLYDPLGNAARFADIKFITLDGSLTVVESSNAVYRTDNLGAYSFSVEFGRFAVLMRYNGNNGAYEKIQSITVNSDTVASTLEELLAYTEPLTPAEILIVQALVAEATEAKDDAESAAIAAGLSEINSAASAAAALVSENAAANSVALLAPVPLNGGVWASGQEFTAYNQYMIFGGEAYSPLPATTLPYTVGVNPDLGFVYQIELNSLQALSGLTEPSNLAQRHRIRTTVAEIATGVFSDGDRLEVTDRANGPFYIALATAPNGIDYLDAGNGNSAVLEHGDTLDARYIGIKPSSTDNLPAWTRAKAMDISRLILPKGDLAFSGAFIVDRTIEVKGAVKTFKAGESTSLIFGASSGVVVTNVGGGGVNGADIGNFRLRGGGVGVGLHIAGELVDPINDSQFSNIRVENFAVGKTTAHSISNTFSNIRLQGCTKSFSLDSQTNNCVWNGFNPVTSSVSSTMSNCEGLVFNAFNCSNQSGAYAFTMFQSEAVINSPYCENITNNIALIGASGAANPSSLVINGGVVDNDFVVGGNNDLLEIKGSRASGAQTKIRTANGLPVNSTVSIDCKLISIAPYLPAVGRPTVFSVNHNNPLFFPASAGGSVRSLSLYRGYYSFSQTTSGNGIALTSSLIAGDQYTLVISARREPDVTELAFKDGVLNLGIAESVIPKSTDEWRISVVPFVPDTSTLDINLNGTLQIKTIKIYKGLVSTERFDFEDYKTYYHDTSPAVGDWILGDEVVNDQPAAGEPSGWLCSASGAPGTWVAKANLA